jgi:hypothetical protein
LVAVITWKNNAQCVMSIMYQHGAHPENWEHHNISVWHCEVYSGKSILHVHLLEQTYLQKNLTWMAVRQTSYNRNCSGMISILEQHLTIWQHYNIAGLEDTTNQAPHGTRDCLCSWEAPDDGHSGVRNM